MRKLKKWEKITFNERTGNLEPFRSFALNQDEMEKVSKLLVNDFGMIESDDTTEEVLMEILQTRSMESLMYPELERLDWSGYCVLRNDGTLLML